MRTSIIAVWFAAMILLFKREGMLTATAAEGAKANSFDSAPAGAAAKESPVTADATPLPHMVNPNTPTYIRDVLPIFMGKCSRCHNDQSKFLDNWFDYKTALRDRSEIKRRVWNSWKGTYFKQPMPIGNSPEFEAMTEEEHLIIKDWVDGGAPYGVQTSDNTPKSKPERIEQGKRLFAAVCAVCHQATAQGIPNRFPPLAGSDFLNSDKNRAVRIVLNGIQGEIFVNGQKFNNVMPAFPLGNDAVAAVLNYVYSSFGNSGIEVTPEEVKALRAQKAVVNSADEKSPFE